MNTYFNLYYLTMYEFQNNPEVNRKMIQTWFFFFYQLSSAWVQTLYFSEIVAGSSEGEILETDNFF